MTASVSSVRLDCFYGSEVKTGTFFRVPKVFESNEVYRAVSLEVKYLYSLRLDRVSISARNGWLDNGRVFIYSLEEVKKCIRAGKNKALQALHDMETLGLIQRKKQGQSKPTRIFLKNIIKVRERLYQLTNEHICYVLDCMKHTSNKIINMRVYTLTALFNAP